MSSSTATKPQTTSCRQIIPPEERFWQRYSPHHEAPLSGVTSTALHLLVLMLILAVIWVSGLLKLDEDSGPVPLEPISFKVGGGGKDGVVPGPGEPGDDRGEEPTTDKAPPLVPMLTPAMKKQLAEEFADDPAVKRTIDEGRDIPFFNLERETRDKLRKALRPGGAGQGPGEEGGKVIRVDFDRNKLTKREKRVLRWGLTFNTKDGKDYKAQLAGLKAMIAVPVEGKDTTYLLIRDLDKIQDAKEEDVAGLDRIYWIDDKPESIKSLFAVLPGMKAPGFFVAFFPKQLEDQLLKMELEYAQQKHNIKDEERIEETKFDVVRTGKGYDVKVRSMSVR